MSKLSPGNVAAIFSDDKGVTLNFHVTDSPNLHRLFRRFQQMNQERGLELVECLTPTGRGLLRIDLQTGAGIIELPAGCLACDSHDDSAGLIDLLATSIAAETLEKMANKKWRSVYHYWGAQPQA